LYEDNTLGVSERRAGHRLRSGQSCHGDRRRSGRIL